MNAVPLVIVRPLQRPKFDNESLDDFGHWCLENAATLARYWTDQGNALGLGKDEDTDFDFWLRCQHDLECDHARVKSRLPHGASL
jgi:hypothetical protein